MRDNIFLHSMRCTNSFEWHTNRNLKQTYRQQFLPVLLGLVVSVDRVALDGVEHVQAIDYLAENDVRSIQMRCVNEAEEELRAVGTWASIGHRKDTTSSVLINEIFVFEIRSIDGLAASAVVCSEITTLSHEACDDSVESTSSETEAFLTSTELFEVF